VDGVYALVTDLNRTCPFLGDNWAGRLVRACGIEAPTMLGDASAAPDLGHNFGHTLMAREVDWLIEREWARTAEDVLWRRTKLGLRFDAQQATALEAYISGQA
jgi:glycerol-3-phosphate dehydrogenase